MAKDIPSQFSDDEMHQIKRFGAALGGSPTPFDEEFEQHYARHAANRVKAKSPAIPQTPDDSENQRQSAQDESISNLASGQNPVIPSPPKKIPSMTPTTPKPVKLGSALAPQPPDAGNL